MNRTALVSTLLCAAVIAALAGCRSTSEPVEQAAARERAERENATRAQAKTASATTAAASTTLDRIQVTGSRLEDAYAPASAPPPPAPTMLMAKSLNPCRRVRRSSEDASVSSVEPATVDALQPRPSRMSATVTATVDSAPNDAVSSAAASKA